MENLYSEILIFHLLSAFSWMALLFYMPRLFVYHIENIDKDDFVKIVKIQEKKIYFLIGFPAMISTILSGLLIIFIKPHLLSENWMIAKLFIIFIMILYTLSLNYLRNNILIFNSKMFRIYNEIPILLLTFIITFAVLKNIPLYFTIFIFLILIFLTLYIYRIYRKKLKNFK